MSRTKPKLSVSASLLWVGLSACAPSLSQLDQGKVLVDQGNEDGAAQAYRRSMNEEPGNAIEAKERLIDLLIRTAPVQAQSDVIRAEAMYQEVLTLAPNRSEARVALAELQWANGRSDDAMQTLSFSGCGPCIEVRTKYEVELGQRALAAGSIERARQYFDRAYSQSGDALALLGLAELQMRKEDSRAALSSLQRARTLVQTRDDALTEFKRIRKDLTVHAAKTGDETLFEECLALVNPEERTDAAWIEFQLELAEHRYRSGKVDLAITQIDSLLKNQQMAISPDARERLTTVLVGMYSIRAAQRLRVGQIAGAENDLTYALRLKPEDKTVKLQRILAVVALGKLDYAFSLLERIPSTSPGRSEVEAILWSYRVEEALKAKDMNKAVAAYDRARTANDELPEVHVAMAQLLRRTPMEGLSAQERQSLARTGIVKYPGEVFRYGEALSELDWARTQAEQLGPLFPWRGPHTDARIQREWDALRLVYPPKVRFRAQQQPLLRFRQSGSQPLSIRLKGPAGFSKEFSLAPSTEIEVEMPNAGFVMIEWNGNELCLVGEAYTDLGVEL